MNLRFVEAFVWVARLKSVTRGAKKLYLTQSAVSNRIAALEDELGVQLLDRRTPGFRLSDAGTRFLEYANQFLAMRNELLSELGTPQLRSFSLRVGAIESVLHTWLIPMMDTLKKHMPQIEFELTIEMTRALNDQIRNGILDLVFSTTPMHGDEIVSEALEPLEMVFVGPKKLVSKNPIPLQEIFSHDLMTFPRSSRTHAALTETLKTAGFADKHVHTISSISAIVRLTESGFGISTLPRAVAKQLSLKSEVGILCTEHALPPLPLYANYWDILPSPEMKQATDQALQFIKNWDADEKRR